MKKQGRDVYLEDEESLGSATSFISVLSLPFLLEGLVPPVGPGPRRRLRDRRHPAWFMNSTRLRGRRSGCRSRSVPDYFRTMGGYLDQPGLGGVGRTKPLS